MIISRYLPEPVLSTPLPPSGPAQVDSPTRLASSRLGDSGRRPFAAARRFGRRRPEYSAGRVDKGARSPAPTRRISSGNPFDRLKPYTVAHQLVHRLKPYEVSDVGLMFRNATWGTLVYWQQLLDSVEIEEPAHEMA